MKQFYDYSLGRLGECTFWTWKRYLFNISMAISKVIFIQHWTAISNSGRQLNLYGQLSFFHSWAVVVSQAWGTYSEAGIFVRPDCAYWREPPVVFEGSMRKEIDLSRLPFITTTWCTQWKFKATFQKAAKPKGTGFYIEWYSIIPSDSNQGMLCVWLWYVIPPTSLLHLLISEISDESIWDVLWSWVARSETHEATYRHLGFSAEYCKRLGISINLVSRAILARSGNSEDW